MDPVTTIMVLLSAAQAVQGIGQSIAGGIKRRKAEREFDEFKIPSSAKTMLQLAQDAYSQNEIPGADLYRSRALSSAARGVEASQRTAESPVDVMGVVGRAYGKDYMDFERNMAIAGAEEKRRNRSVYMSLLDRLSQFETMKWQYNELYPYMQRMGEASQLTAAGGQNIASGLGSGLQIAGGKWEMDEMAKQAEKEHDWRIGDMERWKGLMQNNNQSQTRMLPQMYNWNPPAFNYSPDSYYNRQYPDYGFQNYNFLGYGNLPR